jgi:hypothetical protein
MGTNDETTGQEEGLVPIPSHWFKLGFFLFLLVWLSYLLYEATMWEGFEDYLFIYILAPIVYVLLAYRTLVLLAPERLQSLVGRLEFLDQSKQEESVGEDVEAEVDSFGRESKAEQERYALYMLVWITALPFAIFFFGMAWTLPVYIFGFVWFFTGNLRRAALVTVFAVVFIYILFIEILNLLLWTGQLGLPNPLNYFP